MGRVPTSLLVGLVACAWPGGDGPPKASMSFDPELTIDTPSAAVIMIEGTYFTLRPVSVRCLDDTCDVLRAEWKGGSGDYSIIPRQPRVRVAFEAEESSGFGRVVNGSFEGTARSAPREDVDGGVDP